MRKVLWKVFGVTAVCLALVSLGCPLGVLFDRDYVTLEPEYDFRRSPGDLLVIPFADSSSGYGESEWGDKLASFIRAEFRKNVSSVKIASTCEVMERYSPRELSRADWVEVADSVGARYVLVGKIMSYKQRDLDAPHPSQSSLNVRVSLFDARSGGEEVWWKFVEAFYPPVAQVQRMTAFTSTLPPEEIREGLLREAAARIVQHFYKRTVKRWEPGRPEIY